MKAALARLSALVGRTEGRCLLGLAGPPGVGKSTFSAALVRAWTGGSAGDRVAAGRTAVVVGADGFHLSNQALADRGLADVKGAPETFDVDRFVALLRRLRSTDESTVRGPGFDRLRERTVPDAIEIPATTGLVVVEGNYLLCNGAWRPVRELLDEMWFLDLPDHVRVPRLVARHVAHGRTPEQAREWVQRSDEANARLVARTRPRADAVIAVR